VLRHLVDGARRVDVRARERPSQHPVVQDGRQCVRGRVAEVKSHAVAPVTRLHPREAPLDLGKRLFKGDLFELGGRRVDTAPDDRVAEAVGVFVQVLQARALRADEAPAECVLAIPADSHHLARSGGDL